MHRGHTIALEPTAETAEAMARAAGVRRFTHNWALAEWNRQYEAGERPSARKLIKQFNAIKRELFPWIIESPRDANSQPFADLGQSFKNFFNSLSRKRKGRKIGYPQFKRRGVHDSFYVANDRISVREENGHSVVRLPVIGDVRMREKLRWNGKIMSGRVFRRAEKWFISINVEVDARVSWAHERDVIGVDLGLKTALMTSNGESVGGPKPLKTALTRFRRANRKLSRRKKGSKNRNKARISLARIHQRIANIRKDFWHKTTTNLCRENQTIVIEDLSMEFMLRNRRLSRAASDVALGMFRPMMEYKAKVYGCDIVVADKLFPSTQRCSACGYVKSGDGKMLLGNSTFACESCHAVMDRDNNAARNLQQYPRLAGNWSDSARTPMDDHASTRRPIRASKIAEVGTKPDAEMRTT